MSILEEINSYLIRIDLPVEVSCEIIIFLSQANETQLDDIINILEI